MRLGAHTRRRDETKPAFGVCLSVTDLRLPALRFTRPHTQLTDRFEALVQRVENMQSVVNTVIENQSNLQKIIENVNENMLELITEGPRPDRVG